MRGAASPDGASAWPYSDSLDLSVLRRRGPAVVHQIGLGFASLRICTRGADKLPLGRRPRLGALLPSPTGSAEVVRDLMSLRGGSF